MDGGASLNNVAERSDHDEKRNYIYDSSNLKIETELRLDLLELLLLRMVMLLRVTTQR